MKEYNKFTKGAKNVSKQSKTSGKKEVCGDHYQRMLEFEVASAKTIILKWRISNNRWIRQKTDYTAVHSRHKMQAACNKSVDITISTCGCSKAALWMMNSFEVICTRALAKCTASSSVLDIEQYNKETEHWTTNQQCVVPFDLFILLFSTTSSAGFSAVSPTFSTLHWHGKLRCWIWLDISTFGESRYTRPTLTLIYLNYNMPLSVWNTFSVRCIKSSSSK